MKHFFQSLLFVCFAAGAFAQTDGLSYQAVIIDENPQEIPGADISGNYLSEADIEIRFTIFNSIENIEYQEEQQTKTDPYGMVNLIIGQGDVTAYSAGQWDEIDWDGTPKELMVELSYKGSGFKEFSRQQLLFIPYVYHRNIFASGTLTVEGETVLNDSFTVANQSMSTLTGDLLVQGTATFEGDTYFNTITVEDWSLLHGTLSVGDAASFNSSLNVLNASPSWLSGSLQVDGETNLNSDLNIQGVSSLYGPFIVYDEQPSWLSGALQVDGNTNIGGNATIAGNSILNGTLTANSTSALNGQVTISANVDGAEGSYDAYPLRVEGSDQGIAIKVNSSIPNGSNNFITFFDEQNEAVGRIEGQTLAEKLLSPKYLFESALHATNVGIAIANVVGATTSSTVCAGAGACVTAPIPSLTITSGINLVATIANAAAYQAFALSNLGVTYESGSADYAEWLLRANPSEFMSYGDIVSVKGGEISKNTDFGSQMMVISIKPAVLGNMPLNGEQHLHEKVAFLGQVPVKVRGMVKIGDYILPSGKSDGYGVGVDPSDMKVEDFSKIVGIAWSATDNAFSSYVNVAIGMNRNDLIPVLKKQQNEITEMRNELAEMEAILSELVPGYSGKRSSISKPVPSQPTQPVVNENQQETLSAEEMHPPVDRSFFEECLELLREQLIAQGIDVNTHPVYGPIFNDEDAVERIIDEAMLVFDNQREQAIEIDRANGY